MIVEKKPKKKTNQPYKILHCLFLSKQVSKSEHSSDLNSLARQREANKLLPALS